MYLLTLLYSVSMICVPLFLLLSGYLMHQKQPNRQYFCKLEKTLSIYVLASFCCYAYRQFFSAGATGIGSFGELIRQTLSFQAAPYAWYIEMYIGLFLLIPYLNLIFHGLPSEKTRRQLIWILLFLTALPGIVNVFYYDNGWHFIGNSHSPDLLFPDYWEVLYPITYYFLGAYLREHPLNIKRSTNLLLILAVVLLNGTLSYLSCRGDFFPQGSWQDRPALLNVVQAVLIFQYLAQGNYSCLGPKACRLLARLSDWCLGAYLVSWIFDSIFYPVLKSIQPNLSYQILWYPVIVPTVFLCSLGLSALLNVFYNGLRKAVFRVLPGKSAAA